jgi:transposase
MSNADQRRLTAWRFKVLRQAEERARNVAWTCRHFGISRKTFYKWKRRFAEHGDAGLCDRARTPHRSPRATPPDIVSKLLYLRQHYHFGPGKIADYLKRFHGVSVATSSVHRILGKHGLNRLPANQKHRAHATRWKRDEKPQPGHRLQLDVSFSSGSPGPGPASISSRRLTIARGSGSSRSTTPAISGRPSSSSTKSGAACRSASV